MLFRSQAGRQHAHDDGGQDHPHEPGHNGAQRERHVPSDGAGEVQHGAQRPQDQDEGEHDGGDPLRAAGLGEQDDNGGDNVDGVFVEIGSEPNNLMAEKLGLETDEKKYIKVNEEQKTSVEGVWAAGDCTTNSNRFHQIVCATSEGAIAVSSVYAYLKNLEGVKSNPLIYRN